MSCMLRKASSGEAMLVCVVFERIQESWQLRGAKV